MSLRKVTSLGSNLASVTDLKEFKLHTVYDVILEAIKPLQLVGHAAQFKFESKFEPLPGPANHLAITPEGYSRRQSKILTAISMATLLGPRSGSSWQCLRGSDGRAQIQGVSESAAVAAGSDRLA